MLTASLTEEIKRCSDDKWRGTHRWTRGRHIRRLSGIVRLGVVGMPAIAAALLVPLAAHSYQDTQVRFAETPSVVAGPPAVVDPCVDLIDCDEAVIVIPDSVPPPADTESSKETEPESKPVAPQRKQRGTIYRSVSVDKPVPPVVVHRQEEEEPVETIPPVIEPPSEVEEPVETVPPPVVEPPPGTEPDDECEDPEDAEAEQESPEESDEHEVEGDASAGVEDGTGTESGTTSP